MAKESDKKNKTRKKPASSASSASGPSGPGPGLEKKLKLLPTLREKRHYLVIKPTKQEINEKALREKIDKAILDFLGIYGYAKAGPLFIELRKNYAIVSITTKYVLLVKAALALADLKCVGVSGTIKKVRRFI